MHIGTFCSAVKHYPVITASSSVLYYVMTVNRSCPNKTIPAQITANPRIWSFFMQQKKPKTPDLIDFQRGPSRWFHCHRAGFEIPGSDRDQKNHRKSSGVKRPGSDRFLAMIGDVFIAILSSEIPGSNSDRKTIANHRGWKDPDLIDFWRWLAMFLQLYMLQLYHPLKSPGPIAIWCKNTSAARARAAQRALFRASIAVEL